MEEGVDNYFVWTAIQDAFLDVPLIHTVEKL
jgi:hypothetical protein